MRPFRFLRTGTPPSGGWNVAMFLFPFAVAFLLALVLPMWKRSVSTNEAAASPPPRRVVAMAPNSAEIICALGACDTIVGVSNFCVYPPELSDRPRVGGQFDPDLERIVALKPDLVVLRGRSGSIEQLCRQRDIPVYHDRTETLVDVAACIVELGDRLGRTREAGEVVQQFQARLNAIRERVSNRPRPRVLLTISRPPDRLADLLTTGPGTFLHEMLDIAGGTNVFADLDMAWPQVSAEAIIARRPDVIIELLPEVNLTPTLQQQMLDQWKQLGSIPAVTNGRLYFVTDDHCLIPSPRYVEIIDKVSRLLHPEIEVGP